MKEYLRYIKESCVFLFSLTKVILVSLVVIIIGVYIGTSLACREVSNEVTKYVVAIKSKELSEECIEELYETGVSYPLPAICDEHVKKYEEREEPHQVGEKDENSDR